MMNNTTFVLRVGGQCRLLSLAVLAGVLIAGALPQSTGRC